MNKLVESKLRRLIQKEIKSVLKENEHEEGVFSKNNAKKFAGDDGGYLYITDHDDKVGIMISNKGSEIDGVILLTKSMMKSVYTHLKTLGI